MTRILCAWVFQGDAIAPTADCKQEEYSSHPKRDMPVHEYVRYMKEYRESGYGHDMPCLYLKDWHFVR